MIRDNKLQIFEDFIVEKIEFPVQANSTNTDAFTDVQQSVRISTLQFIDYKTEEMRISYSTLRHSLILTFRKLKNKFMRKSIDQTFKIIFDQRDVILPFKEKLEAYDKKIADLKAAGQIAYAEQLEKEKNYRNYEELVLLNGYETFISEKDVVKAAKNCDKRLYLDWIKNFTREIPSAVIEKLQAARDKNIFDNFVILHSVKEASSLTEKEKVEAKKRDPILFGVSRLSRNLYFIGDWMDEICDLTFEKLLELKNEAKDA
jgi:hypothetical protein